MKIWQRYAIALFGALTVSGIVYAASSVDNLFPVPVFPFPDPAIVSGNVPMTQRGVDYRATVTQLGAILQTNCVTVQNPYPNQLCWDTSVSPASLKAYQNGAWIAIVVPGGPFAPLNSPQFTGVPTAPTAGPVNSSNPSSVYTPNQLATLQWVLNQQPRLVFNNLTLYVSPTGSDAGQNRCDDPTNPCHTIQHAVYALYEGFNFSPGTTATIQLTGTTPATFNAGAFFGNLPIGSGGSQQAYYWSRIFVVGDINNPANFTLACTQTCFEVALGAYVDISGIRMTSVCASGGGCDEVWAHDGGNVTVHNVDFGATTTCPNPYPPSGCGGLENTGGSHMRAQDDGYIRITGDYTISGGATFHMYARHGFIVGWDDIQPAPIAPVVNINLVGNPIFGCCAYFGSFVKAALNGAVDFSRNNFSGTATGQRYWADSSGVIYTGCGPGGTLPQFPASPGRGPNFFPGNSPGDVSPSTFGQYC